MEFVAQINFLEIRAIPFVPLSTFFSMPFSLALLSPAGLLAVTYARVWSEPLTAYSTGPFFRLAIVSHRLLFLVAKKTMVDKLKKVE